VRWTKRRLPHLVEQQTAHAARSQRSSSLRSFDAPLAVWNTAPQRVFARTTPILLAGACAVAIAGASIGFAYSDSGDDALRVGYLAAITLAVAGLGGALLSAEERRRLVGLARVEAERALGRLTAREPSEIRSALRIVFDLLHEDDERWSDAPGLLRLQQEQLEKALAQWIEPAALRAEDEDIVTLQWAISFLLSAGAIDEADELASRLSQVYQREMLGNNES
jgi:hypothetical protein